MLADCDSQRAILIGWFQPTRFFSVEVGMFLCRNLAMEASFVRSYMTFKLYQPFMECTVQYGSNQILDDFYQFTILFTL